MTVSALIAAAFQRIGVVQAGETVSSDDAELALSRLNTLIDAWRAERLFDLSLTRTTWSITSGTGTYAVGTGSAVNIQRPAHVLGIRFVDTSQDPDLELPLQLLTEAQYQAISLKALTSPYPSAVFYNPTIPGSVTFWPVPTSTTLSGVIYTPNTSAAVASSDTLTLAPGYEAFYRDTLAVELCPDFERQPTPALLAAQRKAEARVKRANVKRQDLTVPYGQSGAYDVFSDLNG